MKRKKFPSLSPGHGGSPAVVVLNTPVSAAAVNTWEEEEGQSGVRGGSAAEQRQGVE